MQYSEFSIFCWTFVGLCQCNDANIMLIYRVSELDQIWKISRANGIKTSLLLDLASVEVGNNLALKFRLF